MITLLFLGAWWLFWLMMKWHPIVKKQLVLWIAAGLVILFLGWRTAAVYIENSYPVYIVTRETVLYVGPDSSYGTHGKVPAGATVRAVDAQRSWLKVYTSSKVTYGWIPEHAVVGVPA